MVALVFYVDVTINIQTENYRGFISSKVLTCSSVKTFALHFYENFKHFPSPKGSNQSTMQAKNGGWGTSMFCNEPKNKFQN